MRFTFLGKFQKNNSAQFTNCNRINCFLINEVKKNLFTPRAADTSRLERQGRAKTDIQKTILDKGKRHWIYKLLADREVVGTVGKSSSYKLGPD